MSQHTATERANRFLAIADQFRLGHLLTEQPHPQTKDLSETTARDTAEGLRQLFGVDQDVIEKYREWSNSGSPEQMARSIAGNLLDGGRLFFAGCGATGRLSIQLAAIWRDYWQRVAAQAPTAGDWETRALSVMAGGDFALIKSVEGFEDYTRFGRKQIDDLGVSKKDVVFAITEGGETSFVIGAAWQGLDRGARVYFVYNNPDDLLRQHVQRSREILDEPAIEKINLTTGPMAITGSTRMQATSIQLCVMTTLLEMVLEHIAIHLSGDSSAPETLSDIPQKFLRGLEEVQATLRDENVREQIARLVHREETIHRRNRRNNYFAHHLAIDILTDTTERSPTFSLPSFKKFDDHQAAESTSFLFLPRPDAASAWKELLKRDLQAVEWDLETLGSLLDKNDDPHRQHRIVEKISRNEILRYQIGTNGLAHRPFRAGDAATAIVAEDELASVTEPGGFYHRILEDAHAAGASTAIVFFGRPSSLQRLQAFLNAWPVPVLPVLVPLPDLPGRLPLLRHVSAKMLLNALSTATMVRLGRVLGNVMIRVVPSNLKLIDRSIRYICLFTELDYSSACHLLHRAIDYVSTRMKFGQKYPSPIELSILVTRHRCTFAEAEGKKVSNPRLPSG